VRSSTSSPGPVAARTCFWNDRERLRLRLLCHLRKSVGLEQFTFHDMRASGRTLAAQSGATIPELVARAGPSTPAAVLMHQRAAIKRGPVVAANMDSALRAAAN
jgi:integrase